MVCLLIWRTVYFSLRCKSHRIGDLSQGTGKIGISNKRGDVESWREVVKFVVAIRTRGVNVSVILTILAWFLQQETSYFLTIYHPLEGEIHPQSVRSQ